MSKKIFALVLAAAMVCAFALTTSAAVVPSATVDTTPDVSDSVTSDSGWSMPVGDVAVGSLQNPESLSDEAYRELRDATNQITMASVTAGTKLTVTGGKLAKASTGGDWVYVGPYTDPDFDDMHIIQHL